MENQSSTSRAEAERLLGVASKLLRNKDLSSSRDFAILAQESSPLLEGSDQIITIIDVLSASQNRINNSHPDWYSVLQLPPKTHDLEVIKKQYRRLALLLHPDKNSFPFAEAAFHLVADAWGVLSDPGKKGVFDGVFGDLGGSFERVDLQEERMRKESEGQSVGNQGDQGNQEGREKFPVRRNEGVRGGVGFGGYSLKTRKRGRPKGSLGKKRKVGSNGVAGGGGGGGGGVRERVQVAARAPRSANFWTGCPYCYNLYEYPRMYEGCCMRCVKCKKGFTAEGVGYDPPMVPGRESYYCCWGMFPMGFSDADGAGRGRGGGGVRGFENWMPAMGNGGMANVGIGRGRGNVNLKATTKLKKKGKKVGRKPKVPVGVPLTTGNVSATSQLSPVPVTIVSGNVAGSESPVPVTMVSGNVAGSVSPVTVATSGANAAASVTPGSSSAAPIKRGRGRPRKNPLP